MSRLQTVLVLILGLLVLVLFGRIAWELLAPPVVAAVTAVPSLLHAVPAWVWWTVFGAVWWLPCVSGKRACRRSACSTSAA